MIELNKIYNEDCLAGMKNIPDKSIDLILQDPPYNTTACKWEWDIMEKIDEFWNEWKRIIKDNGAIVMFGSEPFSSKLRLSNLKGYKYDWIWHKNKPSGMFNANKMPMNNHENISCFYDKQPTYNKILEPRECNEASKNRLKYKMTGCVGSNTYGSTNKQKKQYDSELRNPTTIKWFSQTANPKRLHPNEKPISLFEYLIKTYTNEGDTVYDGFMGSGTTAIACIKIKRSYVGFELDTNYFNIANKRIDEHKQIPVQENLL